MDENVRYGTDSRTQYSTRSAASPRGMAQYLIKKGIAADTQSANFLLAAGVVVAVIGIVWLNWPHARSDGRNVPPLTPPPMPRQSI